MMVIIIVIMEAFPAVDFVDLLQLLCRSEETSLQNSKVFWRRIPTRQGAPVLYMFWCVECSGFGYSPFSGCWCF